ncbi:MAG: recombination-associated protein RdgC [Desulfobacteraceae bacterium]|nr:recombination-associated protein RdgC [Desulfobacteraceae bacterium]
MGLLSSTTSLTRYKVDGQIEEPLIETIASGLKKNTIADIDGNPSDRAAGWASFQDPFNSNFEGSSFMIGTYIVFALRIDKKSIPSKMIKKHYASEASKRLKESGRDFLSANEKKIIKDHVLNMLNLKMPSTPNVYDVVWQYEIGELWFFSNLKSANEELENLFIKSFGVSLVRCIPYTMAALDKDLSPSNLDALTKLSANRQNT